MTNTTSQTKSQTYTSKALGKTITVDLTGKNILSIDTRAEIVRDILAQCRGIKEGKGAWQSELCSAYQILMMAIEAQSIRKLTEEEYEVFHAAMYNAATIAPSLTDYISLLHPMISIDSPTLGTDQYFRIMIGYWFFDPCLTPRERGTLLVHEVMHGVLGHYEMRDLDSQLVNIAGDAIINQGIEAAEHQGKMKLPSNPDGSDFTVYPRTIVTQKHPHGMENNLSFHDYYYALLDEQTSQQSQSGQSNSSDSASSGSSDGDSSNGGSSQSDKTNGSSNGSEGPSTGDTQQGDSQSNGTDFNGRGNGSNSQSSNQNSGNGSNSKSSNGASGKNNSRGPLNQEHTGCGTVSRKDAESLEKNGVEKATSLDKEMARAGALAKAMAAAKDHSSAGGAFDQFVLDALRPPKVAWSTVFKNVVSQQFNSVVSGGTDYSFRRPSRRSLPGGFIRPSFIAYAPKMLVGCDCSGSMSSEDYRSAVSEVEGIFRSMDCAELNFVTVDTEITSSQLVKSTKDLKLIGGGGTEMSPLLDYVNALPKASKPDFVILCTDGYFDWEPYLERMEAGRHYIALITDQGGYKDCKNYESEYSNLKVIPIY